MTSWKHPKFPGLILLLAPFFAMPAKAQFEVSPDHFDSVAKNETSRKPKARNESMGQPKLSSTAAGATTMPARVHSQQNAASKIHCARALKPGTTKAHAVRTSASVSVAGQSNLASRVAKATPTNQRE